MKSFVTSMLELGIEFTDVSAGSVIANLDTTNISDEGSTRTVMFVALGLVVVAVALMAVTAWFWRHTVPDPDALEPLAFFEERVIDGTEEVSAPRQRREPHMARRKWNRDD